MKINQNPSLLRTLIDALRPWRIGASEQPKGRGEQNNDELWARHVSRPAARFRTDGEGHEFVIDREELAQTLEKQLAVSGATMRPELREMMTALTDPNHGRSGLVTDLPHRWRSFSLIALELIEQGKGYLLCRACQEIYAAKRVTVARWKSGHEYVTSMTQVQCPARHTLMEFWAHFRVIVREPSVSNRTSVQSWRR